MNKLKIAIIGYGKMGHEVEKAALEAGHEIVCKIDEGNRQDFDSEAFKSADVAIEFSQPGAAKGNCQAALERGVPVVSGTTGWSDQLPEIQQLANEGQRGFLWSSNFSIGVNLFRAINIYATKLMAKFPQYTPCLEETHHIHKLDHPSGTAITIADDLIANDKALKGWVEDGEGSEMLTIHCNRIGEVPGIHAVTWESDADSITLTHSAKSRHGFAQGAVMAAEWLTKHPGAHSMEEMMSEILG